MPCVLPSRSCWGERRLLEKWPAGKKLDVESAGHSQSEIGVADAMRAAIEELLG